MDENQEKTNIDFSLNKDIQSQPSTTQENNKSFLKLIFFSIFFGIIFLVFVYFFIITPKVERYKISKEALETISILKKNTENIESSLEKIKYLLINQYSSDNFSKLEANSSSSYFSQNSQNKNILGEKIKKGFFIGNFMNDLKEKTKNLYESFKNKKTNVAGAKVDELNKIIENNFRQLLEESIKGENNLKIAKEYLKKNDELTKKLKTIKEELSENNKNIIKEIQNYYEDAEKIINYHKILSQTIVDINPLIKSFINSIDLAGNSLSNLDNNKNLFQIKASIERIEKYVDQANKDLNKIINMTKRIENFPKENLPKNGLQYHNHNLEMIAAMTKYMNQQIFSTQNIIFLSKNLINKIELNTITQLDLLDFQNKIFEEAKNYSLSYNEFAIKINSLIIEENNILTSFWQNQNNLRNIKYLYKKISDQEKILREIINQNKIYFFTQ